jgi:hypothetical protein
MNTESFFSSRLAGLMTALCCTLLLLSCSKDKIDMVECSGPTPTYSIEIKAILDASCAKSGCHDAITSQNGVNLSTYATASAISKEARFLGVIQHKQGFPAMPFDGPKLPNATVNLLTCWVQGGSPQ